MPNVPAGSCVCFKSVVPDIYLSKCDRQVTIGVSQGVQSEGQMESTGSILTIKEVAEILRCSKTHVANVLSGKVQGLPRLTHLNMGRRKVVRKEWLEHWMEANKTR